MLSTVKNSIQKKWAYPSNYLLGKFLYISINYLYLKNFNKSPFFKILPNTEFGKLIIYEPITNSKNLALNTFLIDNILNEFGKVDTRILDFKNCLNEKIYKMSYKNLKQYDKMSFDEFRKICNIEEINNLDIVNEIIFMGK